MLIYVILGIVNCCNLRDIVTTVLDIENRITVAHGRVSDFIVLTAAETFVVGGIAVQRGPMWRVAMGFNTLIRHTLLNAERQSTTEVRVQNVEGLIYKTLLPEHLRKRRSKIAVGLEKRPVGAADGVGLCCVPVRQFCQTVVVRYEAVAVRWTQHHFKLVPVGGVATGVQSEEVTVLVVVAPEPVVNRARVNDTLGYLRYVRHHYRVPITTVRHFGYEMVRRARLVRNVVFDFAVDIDALALLSVDVGTQFFEHRILALLEVQFVGQVEQVEFGVHFRTVEVAP